MKSNKIVSSSELNETAQKKLISIRLDQDVIDFFKAKAKNSTIPYQTLINLYLHDCMNHDTQSDFKWRSFQETVYLDSIPNMRESLDEASKEPISECFDEKDLKW